MKLEKLLGTAMGVFDAQSAKIALALEEAARKAVDERTRDAGDNAQKHPYGSSTTLKESSRRAHAAVARLERKSAPVLAEALAGLVSIAVARAYLENIETAIALEHREKMDKDQTGLYAEVRKAIDRVYAFGASKHYWAQLSDQELLWLADLLRWKAANPAHNDPNSPWFGIKAMYDQRIVPSNSFGKLGMSVPSSPVSGLVPVKPTASIPSVEEMKAIAEGWALYDTFGQSRRTQGVGALETDDPYGGFLRLRMEGSSFPMSEREDNYCMPSNPLTAEHWSRFDVPRSPYAVVQIGGRYEFPQLPQPYPPLAKMKLLGVTLGYSATKLQELQDAEDGKASPEILIDTVRAVFLKHNRCHDEDLIRFWLFLLVGRQQPTRVDELFPAGYFHGVRGPNITESRDFPGYFQIVRVADDQEYGHMMRHPTYGPWKDL